jgi:uncharacterized protein DUF5818
VKRWTMLLPIIWLSVVFAWAQQSPEPKPAPGRSEGILGPQLIAWSELQKPQPVPQHPQPIPPPDTQAGQQPSEQSPQPDAKERQEPETPDAAAQTVTGTVTKVAGKYVLQTADNVTYELDDQDKAKPYEGKRVKVTGSLDRTTGILRISSIELLS